VFEASLNDSLGRLGTDRVDAFFVHEPIAPISAAELDEILEFGAAMKRAGKIRGLGIAGPAESLRLAPDLAGFDVVQTRCVDLPVLSGVPRSTPVIVYGAYPSYRSAPRDVTFRDFVDRTVRAFPGTRVIVSSRSVERVRSLVEPSA